MIGEEVGILDKFGLGRPLQDDLIAETRGTRAYEAKWILGGRVNIYNSF